MKKIIIAIFATVLLCLACLNISASDFLLGDMNSDGDLNSDDALHLLRHTLSSEKFSISQNGDINRDKFVNSDDAIYLLRHTLSNDTYPISCEALGHKYSNGVCKYCGNEYIPVDILHYASDVNYQYLGTLENGENMQSFYNELDREMTEFHNNVDINLILDNGNYVVSSIEYTKLGLIDQEALQVWRAYRDDHPLYYWMLDYVISEETIRTVTYSDYANGNDRAALNEQIYKAIPDYTDKVKEKTLLYDISIIYFEEIIDKCEYENAKGDIKDKYIESSIIGSLINKKANFCGYAKLYQLLLNYSGVENWLVWRNLTSEYYSNLIKLDNGKWYFVDIGGAVWSELNIWDIYEYFAQLELSYDVFDIPYAPEAPSCAGSPFKYSGITTVGTRFTVDDITYITATPDEAVVVSYTKESKHKIPETVQYNGNSFKVMDIVDHEGTKINIALFESTECYDYLSSFDNGDILKEFYETLDVKYTMIHTADDFVTSSYGSNRVISTADYDKYGLTTNEALMIWAFYRIDHPLYYWNYYSTSSSPIRIYTTSDYDTPAERQRCDKLVYDGIKKYTDGIAGETNPYLIALYYYDKLINDCEYARDSNGNAEQALWAHSILGAFERNSFVCEGYSKLLQLLLNYSGVENRYIKGNKGGSHSWNLVKLDDGNWYWCDATNGDWFTGYKKMFCGTDVDFYDYTVYTSTPTNQPLQAIPPLPARATTKYTSNDVVVLDSTFTHDGLTYRRLKYTKAECISPVADSEKLATITVDQITYSVDYHQYNWYYSQNTECYISRCIICDKTEKLYLDDKELFMLTFEEDIESEVAKYEGFKVVSPESYNISTDSDGNKELTCGSSVLYLDVDRNVFASLDKFSISFDLNITQNGTPGKEISILSFLSNYQNGSQIPDKSVYNGWLLKYNTSMHKLETIYTNREGILLNTGNSISISLDTTYKIAIVIDNVTRQATVSVDGNCIGTVQDVFMPDFSSSELDGALSIRFNDEGGCAPVFDNFRIVPLK